jgi:hypothetical protein
MSEENEEKIVHTHWLFGMGPNKVVEFNHPVREETDCKTCIHNEVCSHDVQKRCVNFDNRATPEHGCSGCLHHYTKFHKDTIPCFYCDKHKFPMTPCVAG